MKLSDKEWRVLNALWVAPEGLPWGPWWTLCVRIRAGAAARC